MDDDELIEAWKRGEPVVHHQHEIGVVGCGCGWHPSCVRPERDLTMHNGPFKGFVYALVPSIVMWTLLISGFWWLVK